MQTHLTTLSNGIKTLFINAPGHTSASVQIWFRAGSTLENESNEGIAHFLEHMFFKGTSTRPGAKIAHDVESFGGEINAFTSFDYTCYYINSPRSHIQQTVEILLDMVSNPLFTQDDLVPERGVVFEEYRRSQDNPNQYSFQKMQKKCFKGGYAHPILGREDTIKAFSREQLIEFRKNFYNLKNSLLVVSGDLQEKDQIIKSIEQFKMPDGEHTHFPLFELANKSTLDVHDKDVRMTQLTMAIQAPRYDEETGPHEDLAINILGHGETSRLYQRLVIETGLANTASSSTMFMNKGGVHFIRVLFPHKNFSKVLKEFSKIIEDVIANGVEKTEVEKIKNQYVASKVYEKESLESFAFSLGYGFAQSGNINCEEEFIHRVQNTSHQNVNSCLKNIFTKALHYSLQIPKTEDLKKAEKEIQSFMKTFEGKLKKVKSKSSNNLKTSGSKFDPQVKVVELKKGIKLVHRYNNMTPTFVMQAFLKGGLSEENSKTNGHYNMLGNLLTHGHGKYNSDYIRLFFEDHSASLSGFSGKNAYGLNMHALSQDTKTMFEHFMGSLFNPSIPDKFLKHEKELTLRGLEAQKEDPVKTCFRKVNELLFNGHPYAMPVSGNESQVKKIKTTDLKKLHKKNLDSKEILFIYSGDKRLEDVIDLITPYIEKAKPRPEKKVVFKKYKPIVKDDLFIPFDREQTQIFVGFPSSSMTNNDQLYLKIVSAYLSGQSSELFVDVRDKKGLCYATQPIHHSALEGGYWGIYMGSGHDKVKEAIPAIKEILNKIAQNGLPEDEFLRVKKMIEGQNSISVQTNDDYANIYSVTTLQGFGLDYYHETNNKIINMKYDDFIKGIKRIMKQKWLTITVGRAWK